MEVLSDNEVAQMVHNYEVSEREKLAKSLEQWKKSVEDRLLKLEKVVSLMELFVSKLRKEISF